MKINKKLALGAGSAVLVVAVAAGIVAVSMGSSDSTTQSQPSHQALAPSTEVVPTPAAGEGFGTPTTDLTGRKVIHPNNPRGQVLPQREAGQRVECALPDQQPTSPGGVAIEDTFGLPTVFSTTDGPTRFDGNIPAGYRHSPQGAALAAAAMFAKMYSDPSLMVEASMKLGTPTPQQQAAAEKLDTQGEQRNPVLKAGILAPAAFRVLSCDPNFVAVELAIPMLFDLDTHARLPEPKWMGIRANVGWRDGDWHILEFPQGVQQQIYTSLEGWTQWSYN